MTNQQAINLLKGLEQSLDDYCELNDEGKVAFRMAIEALELFGNSERLPSAQPEQRWIPVTLETLPNPNSVVVVCGEKGTWDYGTYRGWYGDIHSWQWKKNTIKHVYWWMYKTDALPEPYREDGEAE